MIGIGKSSTRWLSMWTVHRSTKYVGRLDTVENVEEVVRRAPQRFVEGLEHLSNGLALARDRRRVFKVGNKAAETIEQRSLCIVHVMQ